MEDETMVSVTFTALDADSLKEASEIRAEIVGTKDDVLRFVAAAVESTGAQATRPQRLQ